MSLKLSVKSVNITPPAPVSLAGQFRLRVSEGVESPVTANIFMAESDGEQLVIVSCELCSICNEFMEALREKLSKKCPEINGDKIIVSATHTHTGPDTAPKRHVGGVDPKYAPEGIRVIPNEVIPPEMWDGDKCREWVTDVRSDAMAEAWAARDEGYFGAAFGS